MIVARALAWSSAAGRAARGEKAGSGAVRKLGRGPVILLKLDDVTTNGARPGKAVSERWQRVTDFLAKRKLTASYGIIGWSLEKDNPVYFRWIKDLHKRGAVEFWLHGYHNRRRGDERGEFEHHAAAEQQAILEKGIRLAREKFGIEYARSTRVPSVGFSRRRR